MGDGGTVGVGRRIGWVRGIVRVLLNASLHATVLSTHCSYGAQPRGCDVLALSCTPSLPCHTQLMRRMLNFRNSPLVMSLHFFG